MKRLLCTIGLALGLLTGCGHSDDPAPAANVPTAVPAPQPATPPPPPAASAVSAMYTWERNICDRRFPGTVIEGLNAGVFSGIELSPDDRKLLVAGGCPFEKMLRELPDPYIRFSISIQQRRAYFALFNSAFIADPGFRRLLQAVFLFPDFLESVDSAGMGLAHHLAQQNDVRLMQMLADTKLLPTNMGLQDRQLRVPFHYVRSRQMAEIFWNIPTFWQWYAKKDANQMTPLALLAEDGSGDAAAFAVEKFCEGWFSRNTFGLIGWFRNDWQTINEVDSKQQTALHKATISDNIVAVAALLRCQSTKRNMMDSVRRTALHYAAAQAKFSPSLTHLISNPGDLDLDAQDQDGNTALHLAFQCHNSGAVHILRQAGARMNIRNSQGLLANEMSAFPDRCGK